MLRKVVNFFTVLFWAVGVGTTGFIVYQLAAGHIRFRPDDHTLVHLFLDLGLMFVMMIIAGLLAFSFWLVERRTNCRKSECPERVLHPVVHKVMFYTFATQSGIAVGGIVFAVFLAILGAVFAAVGGVAMLFGADPNFAELFYPAGVCILAALVVAPTILCWRMVFDEPTSDRGVLWLNPPASCF